MSKTRQGGAAVAIIAVLALLVVGGVVWYFVSDVGRARIDATADQLTKWTPENIAKYPVEYLNFCEKKTNEAIQQLKADRIAIEQNRAKLKDMKDTASAKVQTGDRVLKDLKEAYKKAEDTKTWPVSWNNQTRDQAWMQSYIVKIFKETEIQRTILNKVDGGLKKLDAQSTKIEKAQGEATTQLADIAANRELLKVQKLTDEMKDRLVNIKGAVQGVMDVAGDSGGMPSLAELTNTSTPAADAAEFKNVIDSIK